MSANSQSPRRLVGAGILLTLVLGGMAFAAWGPRSNANEWGPLAVSRDPLGGDFSRTEGVLGISEGCVVLRRDDDTAAILVWWRDQVNWDAGGRQILFQKRDDTIAELADGQRIVAGGSGTLSLPPTLDWVAEPDPSCGDSYWFIGDVELFSAE